VKILFLGYSSIVRRRILPILPTIADIRSIAVASLLNFDHIKIPDSIAGTAYSDYETALDESGADIVYVSTINSEHTRWAKAALQRGLHTIVDKPATLNLEDTQRLLDMAAEKNCCLAESTVYAYHPQIKAIQQVFVDNDDLPIRITSTFSFPPMSPDNFRYQRKFGGGALWDLGQYAMTPGRLFFGQEPDEISGIASDSADGVEISFSVLATYDQDRSLIGHFGFNTAYRNHIEVLGEKTVVWADRIFTTPETLENNITIIQNNQQTTRTVPPASSFACFLQTFVTAIQNQDYEQFGEDLLVDARTMQHMRDKLIN